MTKMVSARKKLMKYLASNDPVAHKRILYIIEADKKTEEARKKQEVERKRQG